MEDTSAFELINIPDVLLKPLAYLGKLRHR